MARATKSLAAPTAIEQVSGSSITQAAMVSVAAFTANPLAALLPVLTTTLAGERQRKRIEKALIDIDKTLHEHREILKELSDSQYKLINEAILALFQTTHTKKIEYLKATINNIIEVKDILPQESILLGRIIR